MDEPQKSPVEKFLFDVQHARETGTCIVMTADEGVALLREIHAGLKEGALAVRMVQALATP